MKVFVTKYALTKGIYQEEVREGQPSGGWRYLYTLDTRYPQQFVLGRDAFEDLETAKAQVGHMRTKKIASLKKQLAKVEKMVI